MKKLFVGTMLGLGLFTLLGAFFQRHALACDLLPLLDYPRIDEQMFVQPGMTEAQIEALRMHASAASARIRDTYGAPISRPRMLITSDVAMAARWGANHTASMHRMPWGSCIIVGPNGQNVDVIAHEWLHAEIMERVGFLRFLQEIPIWFDEGAALTLDHRPPFLPENISLSAAEILAVQKLGRARDFFSGNTRQNYQAARMAVQPLIRNEQFYDDLARISAGESFETVFMNGARAEPGGGGATD